MRCLSCFTSTWLAVVLLCSACGAEGGGTEAGTGASPYDTVGGGGSAALAGGNSGGQGMAATGGNVYTPAGSGGASGLDGAVVGGDTGSPGGGGAAANAGASGTGPAAGTGGAAASAASSGTGPAAGVSGAAGAAASSGTAPVAGTGGAAANGSPDPDSAAALAELEAHLAIPRADRPALETQPFADAALTQQDAERAKQLLWHDFAEHVRETRAGEVGATERQASSISMGGYTMRYYMATRGDNPPGGRSLFISMHGGGNTTTAQNDQQWENQITLVDGYNPTDALWVAPRAPTDAWNMWFTEEIDGLFERLITNLIVFEEINPNKVYLTGYSAGGDGVYQLGPRMADHWAGAGMSAGHPNDASPLNLRNVAFAIHVGGQDTAYERNQKAEEWGLWLEELAANDPGGYPNQWQVHPGLPHWMNLADAVSIPFLQSHERDPMPPKIVWLQASLTQSRFYWLAVDEADETAGSEVHAAYAGDTITITEAQDLQRLTIRLSDAMVDLDQPLRVERLGTELFSGTVSRTIAVIARTLEERGDPTMMFCAEISVELQ